MDMLKHARKLDATANGLFKQAKALKDTARNIRATSGGLPEAKPKPSITYVPRKPKPIDPNDMSYSVNRIKALADKIGVTMDPSDGTGSTTLGKIEVALIVPEVLIANRLFGDRIRYVENLVANLRRDGAGKVILPPTHHARPGAFKHLFDDLYTPKPWDGRSSTPALGVNAKRIHALHAKLGLRPSSAVATSDLLTEITGQLGIRRGAMTDDQLLAIAEGMVQ